MSRMHLFHSAKREIFRYIKLRLSYYRFIVLTYDVTVGTYNPISIIDVVRRHSDADTRSSGMSRRAHIFTASCRAHSCSSRAPFSASPRLYRLTNGLGRGRGGRRLKSRRERLKRTERGGGCREDR